MNIRQICVASMALVIASPALAVVSPFGGSASGIDTLGHGYSASGTHWGEPGYLNGTLTFNPLLVSNSAGSYATSFSFTWLKGVSGSIDQTPSSSPFGSGPETRFSNLADGVAWLVTYDDKTVTFTAPTMASKLDVGDQFFVNVAFTGAIDPLRFSFAGLWDDADVGSPAPEPASWAMMLVGFGAIGAATRSRRKAAVSFG